MAEVSMMTTAPSTPRSSSGRSAKSRVRLPWLLCAAGGFLLTAVLVLWAVGRAADRTEVLVVARPVKAGEVLSADAVTVRAASLDGGLGRMYRASQRDVVVGAVATVDLETGDVLGPAVLAPAATARAGEQLVGAVVRSGRYPPHMRAGEQATAVNMADSRAPTPATVPVRVVAVTYSETLQATVTLAVPTESAAIVGLWAGTDGLGLVVTPPGATG